MANALWASAIVLAADQQAPAGGSQLFTMLMLLSILPLFWFLMIRPQQKEQAKRRQMIEAIKKNDRVLTVGGIYGVVTNIHREADEITIKVDEATNTKLRVTLGSISRVLSEETPSDSGSASS